MNRRKAIGLVIGIFIYSLCITFFTFAYFNWRSSENVGVAFTVKDVSGAIVYSCDNSQSDACLIQGTLTEANSYQTSATITFWKEPEYQNKVYGHIYLNVSEIGAYLAKEKALKWEIYEGKDTTGTLVNAGNFNGEAVNGKIPLDVNLELNTTETKYTVVIYLDVDEVDNTDNLLNQKIVTAVSAEASVSKEVDNVDIGLYDSLYINSVSNDGYVITATARDFNNNITAYQVTTSSTTPTSWKTLTAGASQEIDYTVSASGTYYVWFKNSEGDVVSKSIVISDTSTTETISKVVTITTDSLEKTYFNSKSSVTIPLYINSANSISDGLSVDEISVLINGTIVSGVTKDLRVSDDNSNFYNLVLDNLTQDGTLSLNIAAGVVKDSENNTNSSTTFSIGTVDNVKPVCSFGSIPTVTKNVDFTVDLTCTDSGSKLVWAGITTDRLTTLDNDLKIVSVSEPTAVTNGYKYTVTLNTSSINSEGYNLILKSDTVWDNSGNYNAEVSSTVISGPAGKTYTVTFVKGNNISTIGATSLSCSLTGNSNTCSVTAPTISPNSGYSILGWTLSDSTKYIDPGDKITVSENVTYYSNVADITAPVASISTTSTLKSTNQTATLKCTDGAGVVSYYWGTSEPTSSSTYTSITSTTSMSIEKKFQLLVHII